jgi:hypothetical protein
MKRLFRKHMHSVSGNSLRHTDTFKVQVQVETSRRLFKCHSLATQTYTTFIILGPCRKLLTVSSDLFNDAVSSSDKVYLVYTTFRNWLHSRTQDIVVVLAYQYNVVIIVIIIIIIMLSYHIYSFPRYFCS